MIKKSFLLILMFTCTLGCKRDVNGVKGNSSNGNSTDTTFIPELETVNFYLENSGSMNGYVNGNTEFKRAIVKMLSDLDLLINKSDAIKVNLVNMEVYPYNDNYRAFNSQITSTGIPRIGDVTNSDINLVFENILENTKSSEVSILVTDAIYSINNSGNELGCEGLISRLETKSLDTRNLFYQQLQGSELSMLLLKMKSDFNGRYYPAQGGVVEINQTRHIIFIFLEIVTFSRN